MKNRRRPDLYPSTLDSRGSSSLNESPAPFPVQVETAQAFAVPSAEHPVGGEVLAPSAGQSVAASSVTGVLAKKDIAALRESYSPFEPMPYALARFRIYTFWRKTGADPATAFLNAEADMQRGSTTLPTPWRDVAKAIFDEVAA